MLKLTGILIAIVFLVPHPAVAAKSPSLVMNGKLVKASPSPEIRRGRLYVSVFVLRKLGLVVRREGGGPHRVWVAWPETDDFIHFKPGRAWLVYEGPKIREETLDTTPYLRRGTLMIPLGVIALHWECPLDLEWNAKTKTASIRRDR